MLHPVRTAGGRTHETADRLGLGMGLTALAAGTQRRQPLARLPRDAGEPRGQPGRRGHGAPAGADLVDLRPFGSGGGLAVVPWEGPGPRARRGAVARDGGRAGAAVLRPPGRDGPFAEVAALALLVALAVDRPGDRLALALGVEGVVVVVPRVRPPGGRPQRPGVRPRARRRAPEGGRAGRASRRGDPRAGSRYRGRDPRRGTDTDGPPQAHRPHRARQPQARPARLGALQPRHAGRARALRDRHHRRPGGGRARPAGPPLPERPDGRRPAGRRRARRGPARHRHLLLGPAGAPAARRGREGAAAHRRRPRRADRLQPVDRRLHPLEPAAAHPVPGDGDRGRLAGARRPRPRAPSRGPSPPGSRPSPPRPSRRSRPRRPRWRAWSRRRAAGSRRCRAAGGA